MEEQMINGSFEERIISNKRKEIVEEDQEVVLPGFRFHPTDEELVGFYLRRKVEKKKPLSIDIIKQIDIYKYDPWDLPKLSNIGEKEWYFFCMRGRKYRNSIRPNRVTGSGFWKATGIDRPIYSCDNADECIGLKKSLVYYRGSAGKGSKTDWMMHEFRLPSSSNKTSNKSPPSINEAESWTICRIFKRNISFKKYTQQIKWKEGGGIGMQNSGDSSSKTSSLDSETGEEQRCFHGGWSFKQGDESCVNRYMEENWQWNSEVQTNSISLQTNFVNLNQNNEIFREGNWDEIGRMVDYMMEPVTTYDSMYF